MTRCAGRSRAWADLRILATSDLHAHVLAYDYAHARPAPGTGFAATAGLIRRARAEAANTLLADDGDFLQGTPLGEPETAAGDTHPMIAAFEAAGVDAVTLGNHELNFGLDVVWDALADAGFAAVSANLLRQRAASPLADRTLLAPYALFDRPLRDRAGAWRMVRIGVIGFLPPQIGAWDRAALAGRAEARGIVEAARAWVPRMRTDGAEIVLALAHSGIGDGDEDPAQENAALALAGVGGIDAVIAGHSHLAFPGDDFTAQPGRIDPVAGRLAGKPAVMPGMGGSHLGIIDLALAPGRAGWRVREHRAELRPIARRGAEAARMALVAGDGDVAAAVDAAHSRTCARLARVIGRTGRALHSYFALAGPTPAVRLVADAQAWTVARALAGTAHGDLPLLSAAAPAKCGGRAGPEDYCDIPAGPFRLRHVTDLAPHPNRLVAVRITGRQLAAWLEQAAAIFATLAPGAADQPLLAYDTPGYSFDIIHGLSYEIDLSQPAMRAGGPGRIRELRHRGRRVDPGAEFVVATNNYRVDGVAYPAVSRADVIVEPAQDSRESLAAYVAAHEAVAPEPAPVWRFSPLGGTPAVLETGGAARAHTGALAPTPDDLGLTASGFLRLRLHL